MSDIQQKELANLDIWKHAVLIGNLKLGMLYTLEMMAQGIETQARIS